MRRMLLALLVFALPSTALLVDACSNSTFTSSSSNDASIDANVGESAAPDVVEPDVQRPFSDAAPSAFCDGGHVVCDDFDNELEPAWPTSIWPTSQHPNDLSLVTDQFVSPPASMLVQPDSSLPASQPLLTYDLTTSSMLNGFQCEAMLRVDAEPLDGGIANLLTVVVGDVAIVDTFTLRVFADANDTWGANLELNLNGAASSQLQGLGTLKQNQWVHATVIIHGVGASYDVELDVGGVSVGGYMGTTGLSVPMNSANVQIGIDGTSTAWKGRFDNVACDRL